jgi:predicted O-methyltransferase YrrM
VEFETIANAVDGIPFMSVDHGRRVYEHIRRTEPAEVLELGTAHGVSAAYMAAALEANGSGRLTTVDHGGASYEPSPAEVLAPLGLAHRVTIVRKHSSYNWFLKELIERQSDRSGNCQPVIDFCYLDGAKNWNIDGLAVLLLEKLLRPGGWLLMDDLEWTYEKASWWLPEANGRPLGPSSDAERTEPHLRAVFELLVKQHPSFTQFIVEDAWYGWAQKQPGASRRYTLESSQPLTALVATWLRRRRRQRG